MLNLILKDLLIQKKMLLLGFIYVTIMIVAMQNSGAAMFSAGVVALTYILSLTACAYDDKNKTDIMLNSLPVGRRMIVIARYISLFVFAAIGTVYYILVTGIINISGFPLKTYPVTIEAFFGALFAIIFINGIYYPVFFKVGYIKARMINFILFFTVFLCVGAVSFLIQEQSENALMKAIIAFFTHQTEAQIILEMIGIILVILVASVTIAVKLYESREF